MSDWVKESSTKNLRQMRVAHSPNSPEHRAADEEIRRREAREATKEAERSEQARVERDERRFQTQLEETKRQGSATRRIALGSAVVALISVLVHIWLHFHPNGAVPVSISNPAASSPTTPTPKP